MVFPNRVIAAIVIVGGRATRGTAIAHECMSLQTEMLKCYKRRDSPNPMPEDSEVLEIVNEGFSDAVEAKRTGR